MKKLLISALSSATILSIFGIKAESRQKTEIKKKKQDKLELGSFWSKWKIDTTKPDIAGGGKSIIGQRGTKKTGTYKIGVAGFGTRITPIKTNLFGTLNVKASENGKKYMDRPKTFSDYPKFTITLSSESDTSFSKQVEVTLSDLQQYNKKKLESAYRLQITYINNYTIEISQDNTGEITPTDAKLTIEGYNSKLAYAPTARGAKMLEFVKDYTQDIDKPSRLGNSFSNLPKNLFLKRYDKWDSFTDNEKEAKSAFYRWAQFPARNLDVLFVDVKDGVHNHKEVYDAIVVKKQIANTHIFMIGDKAKHQHGSTSKTFAGGKVSTATFNKYAAVYKAGFQAAIGAINYSGQEGALQKTTIAFLIGSLDDSEDKKKAYAFKRGVDAAIAHPKWKSTLKVKFISKTEDKSKKSKKLIRDLNSWKEINKGKRKLYEFASSDTFSDADRRVVYIAGATAKDWRGEATGVGINMFKKSDNIGLIGALYNYKNPESTSKGTPAKDLTTKKFSRGVYVVTDRSDGFWAASDSTATVLQNKDHYTRWTQKGGGDKTTLFHRHASNEGVNADWTGINRDEPNKDGVWLFASVGKEVNQGINEYVIRSLRATYFGEFNYMVGRHVIFGANLSFDGVMHNAQSIIGKNDDGTDKLGWNAFGKEAKTPWSYKGGKDNIDLAQGRWYAAIGGSWERELFEEELIKKSAWLK